MLEPPESIRSQFIDAGWYPERRAPTGLAVLKDHPATVVLMQFGGLNVGRCGTGEECATSNVAFQLTQSEPDSTDLEKWGELLGTHLIGVAELHCGHGELFVDTAGRYFFHSLVHDAFSFLGDCFQEAMERLLLGRRSRPMLLPGHSRVTHYGISYSEDSPAIYRYK